MIRRVPTALPPEVDAALFNVLCFFAPPSQAASQEARCLASDALAEPKGRVERVRRVVEIIDEHGWANSKDTEIMRGFVFTAGRARGRLG